MLKRRICIAVLTAALVFLAGCGRATVEPAGTTTTTTQPETTTAFLYEETMQEITLPNVYEATGIRVFNVTQGNYNLSGTYLRYGDGPALSVGWAEGASPRIVSFGGQPALAFYIIPHTGVGTRHLRVYQVVDGQITLVYDESWNAFSDGFELPDWWLETEDIEP